MNALWITRMSAYKSSPECLESAKTLIALKMERKNVLLKRYKKPSATFAVERARSLQDVLLMEARAAKQFWREFRGLLPPHTDFTGREVHAPDNVNRLLDIGYHHITNIVKKLLDQHDISAALGLLHVARNADSAPLAYDLVEMFRADIVDAEVLRFLRLKKKSLTTVEQRDIGHFLHEVNQRLDRRYYLKDFRMCHTYRYYMELQLLKFIKAVDHREVFAPLHLPTRHDSRCLTETVSVVSSEVGSLVRTTILKGIEVCYSLLLSVFLEARVRTTILKGIEVCY